MTAPTRPAAPAEPPASARVIVVGTLNVDLVCRVPALPRPGETILAESVTREFGGKGANQAVAAARQQARVAMIGAVGDDPDGAAYLDHLRRENIDASRVTAVRGVPTGTAHVYVDGRGENSIVVNRGANARLDAALVRHGCGGLSAHDLLVVQLECPLAAAVASLEIAATSGARSLLNASPVTADFPWGAVAIGTVIVNKLECRACFGSSAGELLTLAPAARADFLARRAVRNLVITQGADPTLWLSAERVEQVSTHRVVPRDTVGAGDTFAGVLAAQLARGETWPAALRHANVAAALSTLGIGAQTAMPRYAEVAATLAPSR